MRTWRRCPERSTRSSTTRMVAAVRNVSIASSAFEKRCFSSSAARDKAGVDSQRAVHECSTRFLTGVGERGSDFGGMARINYVIDDCVTTISKCTYGSHPCCCDTGLQRGRMETAHSPHNLQREKNDWLAKVNDTVKELHHHHRNPLANQGACI